MRGATAGVREGGGGGGDGEGGRRRSREGRGAKAVFLLPGIMDHSCMQRRGIRLNYGVQRGVEADISPLGEGKQEISVYA